MIYVSKVALAARWQGKYETVHDALMRMSGTLDKDRGRAVATGTRIVDLARLDEDLEAHAAQIEASVGEASIQARMIGLRASNSAGTQTGSLANGKSIGGQVRHRVARHGSCNAEGFGRRRQVRP